MCENKPEYEEAVLAYWQGVEMIFITKDDEVFLRREFRIQAPDTNVPIELRDYLNILGAGNLRSSWLIERGRLYGWLGENERGRLRMSTSPLSIRSIDPIRSICARLSHVPEI